MRHLSFIIFAGFCFFSQAQTIEDVAGEWTWSSAGCRNPDLSADSHVQKPKSQNPEDIGTADLTLRADGFARMVYEQAGQSRDEEGRFEIRGGRVIISISEGGQTFEVFSLEIAGDRLIVVARPEDLLSRDTLDRLREVCGVGKVFVYVLARAQAF